MPGDPKGHSHSHTPELTHANARMVGLAALLIGTFMLVEVAGGILSGSLALLADAGHMLTDFGALALAWIAFRLSARPADWRRTYGFDRFAVLVAFVNGLALFVIAFWVLWEAAERFASPTPVLGETMLVVAVLGLIVNLVALWLLRRADRNNLNIRAASLHVLGDLLGSVGAIAAAAVILATGWTLADPILSVLVAFVILKGAWGITRDSAHILLEGAPEGLDAETVATDLVRTVDGVARVHHVHAWSITEGRPMLTMHARIEPGVDASFVRAALKARLAARFHVEHATIEIEEAGCETAVPPCQPLEPPPNTQE